MRLIGAASAVFALVFSYAISGVGQSTSAQQQETGERTLRDGQAIFRFDTFGDEQLWTSVLHMNEAIATVDPATALAVGLKVDLDALPRAVVAALRAGQVDLKNPAVTKELLRLNAVVGVKGAVSDNGELTSVGITCALCHSTVDNSFAPGIGRRLDGWANVDLNVGAIVALSPALPDALKAEFRTWGPGKYDPRHHAFDGTNLLSLNSPSLPIVIPSIYGLQGVGFETYTADGPISYWNSYVGVGQMGGHGNFSDPRIGLSIKQTPDLVTPKLAPLLAYQLSLRVPDPPKGSFDKQAAQTRRAVVSQRSRMRHVPSVAESHRCTQWSQANRAVPARSGGGRYRSGLCRKDGNQEIPDHAAARTLAACAVLSRRQCPRPPRGGQSLRSAVRARADGGPEG